VSSRLEALIRLRQAAELDARAALERARGLVEARNAEVERAERALAARRTQLKCEIAASRAAQLVRREAFRSAARRAVEAAEVAHERAAAAWHAAEEKGEEARRHVEGALIARKAAEQERRAERTRVQAQKRRREERAAEDRWRKR
jgi:hypothetical protein